MNNKEDNRRDFTRIDAQLPADIATKRGLQIACETRDVSYRGLFLLTNQALEMGEELDVTVWLSERGCGVGLRVAGTVTRLTSDGVGIRVSEIAHESFMHLRRLITYNAGDPDTADGEIRRDLGLGETG